MSCPQTHNCLLTGYGAHRAPSASQDPIPGLLRDWVQIFETPTGGPNQAPPPPQGLGQVNKVASEIW